MLNIPIFFVHFAESCFTLYSNGSVNFKISLPGLKELVFQKLRFLFMISNCKKI